VPPGKSCWSRRRIQIRKKPQEHTNNSSLALTHNKFLNQKCQSGRFLPDKQDLPFPFLDRWFTSCPSFGTTRYRNFLRYSISSARAVSK
jgi:hypothetical protein